MVLNRSRWKTGNRQPFPRPILNVSHRQTKIAMKKYDAILHVALESNVPTDPLAAAHYRMAMANFYYDKADFFFYESKNYSRQAQARINQAGYILAVWFAFAIIAILLTIT